MDTNSPTKKTQNDTQFHVPSSQVQISIPQSDNREQLYKVTQDSSKISQDLHKETQDLSLVPEFVIDAKRTHIRKISSNHEFYEEMNSIPVKRGHTKTVSIGTNVSDISRCFDCSPVPSTFHHSPREQQISHHDTIINISDSDSDNNNDEHKLINNQNTIRSQICSFLISNFGSIFLGLCIISLSITLIIVGIRLINTIRDLTDVLSKMERTFTYISTQIDFNSFNTAAKTFPTIATTMSSIEAFIRNNTVTLTFPPGIPTRIPSGIPISIPNIP